ncbi:FadR/GntR family transcriptional regulator [Sphingomonas sp.]|uniref:FadR/GntR family transcriptional regulator n=1 Tax=Sphingomonas sp. TaxID=28214 RepID=UPI002DD698D8|nr:GntR family transcriptional regulator [Sphingomonas sp.]
MDSGKARATPSFSAVRTKRAFEAVTDQIRTQLANGLLRQGDRLPAERELAEQFGLSRNTVREGLRALEVAGLVELKKGATGGAFIRRGQAEVVVSSFSDLYRLGAIRAEHLTEGRLIVGTAVTRLACQRATLEDIDLLQENVDDSAGSDAQTALSVNLDFHRLLARATSNPVLIVLTDALIGVQRELLKIYEPASQIDVIASRRRLLTHLRSRDEVAAVSEMEQHLRLLQSHYLEEDFRYRRRVAAEAKAAGEAASDEA